MSFHLVLPRSEFCHPSRYGRCVHSLDATADLDPPDEWFLVFTPRINASPHPVMPDGTTGPATGPNNGASEPATDLHGQRALPP